MILFFPRSLEPLFGVRSHCPQHGDDCVYIHYAPVEDGEKPYILRCYLGHDLLHFSSLSELGNFLKQRGT